MPSTRHAVTKLSDTKNQKDKRMQSFKILHCFQIFSHMIWDSLIYSNEKTNHNKDSITLIILCHEIRKILYGPFIQRGEFKFSEIRQINPLTRPFVRNLIFDRSQRIGNQIIGNQIIENQLIGYPHLRSLTLTENSAYTVDQLATLSPTLTSLEFEPSFNQSIKPGVLPSGLVSLKFGNAFNKKIKPGTLPDTLRSLSFGKNFNSSIDLPIGLTKLSFGTYFDSEIKQGTLPENLTELTFGFGFNQKITGVLPSGLKKLILGNYFDHPIDKDVLPKNLVHLEISSEYRQPLANVLPELKILYFNPGVLICLGRNHLKLVPGLIPQSVRELGILDNNFDQELYVADEEILPPGLTSLTLSSYYSKPLIKPNGLRFLPLSLKRLCFCHTFNFKDDDIIDDISELNFGQNDYQGGKWIFRIDKKIRMLVWEFHPHEIMKN